MDDLLGVAGEISSGGKVVQARALFFRNNFNSPALPFDLDGHTGLKDLIENPVDVLAEL